MRKGDRGKVASILQTSRILKGGSDDQDRSHENLGWLVRGPRRALGAPGWTVCHASRSESLVGP